MDLKITMGSCRYLISSFHLYVGKYVHTYKSSKRSRKFKISNDFQNVILRRPLKQLSPKLGAMHHLVPISHFMMSSLLKNTFDLKICTNMLLLQFIDETIYYCLIELSFLNTTELCERVTARAEKPNSKRAEHFMNSSPRVKKYIII